MAADVVYDAPPECPSRDEALARLGFGAWGRNTLLDDAAGPEMSMVGATMDLCPFGVAPLSTAHVDLVLAVCA